MWRIFQDFVFNFLEKEQSTYKVESKRLSWAVEPIQPERQEDLKSLPVMRTDISLSSSQRILIIDTKYYVDALKSNQDSKPKVRADHLYQINAYLNSLEMRKYPSNMSEGLLLYPVNGNGVNLAWNINGHTVRVRTLDLGLDWRSIHDSLLDITGICISDANVVITPEHREMEMAIW
jgi:5-methylcytosine-specific restriction enzyme subunit McrC